MDSGDYVILDDEYETDPDCDQKSGSEEDEIDQDVCDATVLSDAVQWMTEDEIRYAQPPGFFQIMEEIIQDHQDNVEDLAIPDDDRLAFSEIPELLENLAHCDRYLQIQNLIDTFMARYFSLNPRNRLNKIQLVKDQRDLREIYESVWRTEYKDMKFCVYSILLLERWLFIDAKKKHAQFKKLKIEPEPLQNRKLLFSMAYAKVRLYS